jgi:glycosyltransferase involved in cell wall biosynthesis
MTAITIVVPTHGRLGLLERTLASLAGCRFPPAVRRVVVAENGGAAATESLVRTFGTRMPVEHSFTDAANKSAALNAVLRAAGDEFLLFFDDDIRIHRDTLLAYAGEVGSGLEGAFYGGPCRIDYEEEPPGWLKSYLPPSAVGWSLGDRKERLARPIAMGCNWGALASDLREAGGFDERKGPGTSARGQETDMQRRLLRRGVAGYYLPGALVWHFVPKERCTPDWTLCRVEQAGVRDGMDLARKGYWNRITRKTAGRLGIFKTLVFMRALGPVSRSTKRFEREYSYRYRRGLLKGLDGAARPLDLAEARGSTTPVTTEP